MEYPNSGALFPNKNKTSDAQPNARGNVKIERGLLKELMAESDGELIEFEISAWTKEFKDGKFLSLKVAKPYKKNAAPRQQQEDDGEDIPF
jgi:hypothetical protein